MNEITKQIEITTEESDYTLDIVAEYQVSGAYYPQTRLQPAEYPEIEVTGYKIMVNGKAEECPEWLERLIDKQNGEEINLACYSEDEKNSSSQFDDEPPDFNEKYYAEKYGD